VRRGERREGRGQESGAGEEGSELFCIPCSTPSNKYLRRNLDTIGQEREAERESGGGGGGAVQPDRLMSDAGVRQDGTQGNSHMMHTGKAHTDSKS
jgi:hypothetical protein